MGWKIYAVLLVLILVVGAGFENTHLLTVGDWLGDLLDTLVAIGVFYFSLKKDFISAGFWKVILWLDIASKGVDLIYNIIPSESFNYLYFLKYSNTTLTVSLISILIILPGWYALYSLGYKKMRFYSF